MSPDLIAFLKAWHEWATNGAPDGEPFTRQYGLCANANRFGRGRLGDEMERAVDDRPYPFGGHREYDARFFARTQHECPKRLAWVRERLIEARELVA